MNKEERTLKFDLKKHFNIDIDKIQHVEGLIEQIAKSIAELRDMETYKRLEVVLNENLITTKDILNNYRTILGCRVSYADLEKEISFIVREDKKPTYEELENRIDKAIEYIIKNNFYRVITYQEKDKGIVEIDKYEILDILRGENNEK